MKLVTFLIVVVLLAAGLKYGRSYLTPNAEADAPALQDVNFSSEESGLMSTVLSSALRLFSGSATREQLAQELSEKLYSDRSEAGDMSELGIEIVNPKSNSARMDGPPATDSQAGGAPVRGSQPHSSQRSVATGQGATAGLTDGVKLDSFAQVWAVAKPYSLELAMVPVAFLGLLVVHFIRRRSRKELFVPEGFPVENPMDSGPFHPKHAVHSLNTEDFEMLVALIHQRQGYRILMPAGMSGGRGGDFTLARKSERVLVQCKKLNMDHMVPVDRVRELHEAALDAGLSRSMFVSTCGFSWDARNYAKKNGITVINARILDDQITAACETPGENLLDVPQWASKLMSKVELTAPVCPSCDAKMDQIQMGSNSMWVCSQRPDCRGRRCARRYCEPLTANS